MRQHQILRNAATRDNSDHYTSSNSNKPEPLAVSVGEAAALAGVSRSMLYTEMAAGRLAFAKVGKRRLVPMEALLDWLRAATTEAA